MKLESLAVTVLVATGAFLLCMIVIGDSVINSLYYVPADVQNYNTTFAKTLALREKMNNYTNSSYELAKNPTTSFWIPSNVLTQWIAGAQQLLSGFEIGISVMLLPFDAQGGISEIGSFLKMNYVFIALIMTFLVLAVAFAVAAFFRGRRP